MMVMVSCSCLNHGLHNILQIIRLELLLIIGFFNFNTQKLKLNYILKLLFLIMLGLDY